MIINDCLFFYLLAAEFKCKVYHIKHIFNFKYCMTCRKPLALTFIYNMSAPVYLAVIWEDMQIKTITNVSDYLSEFFFVQLPLNWCEIFGSMSVFPIFYSFVVGSFAFLFLRGKWGYVPISVYLGPLGYHPQMRLLQLLI